MVDTTIVAGHPRLTPHLVLLARRDERVQIGWSPDTRLILAPPPGTGAATMIGALRLLDGQRSLPEVIWRAAERGVDSAAMAAVVRLLDEAGLLHRQPPPGSDSPLPTLLVVGRGPVADAVGASLRHGTVVDHRTTWPRTVPTDVAAVVLTDSVVTSPDVVRHLMHDGVPHLPVRCRDGVGVVGPFVVPGHTACLHCVELTRCDLDREWPYLAAQLGGRAASASPTTLAATAAFAVGRVHDFLGDRLPFSQRTTRTRPSALEMGHSQEIDTAAGTVRRRRWRRHPVCPCSGHAPA
ncbi:TOMM precursor leader peptide-binding protein [Rhodococcoides corynebacterioides]|uniref:TOMM precursor leader peptide-binding protein n=1 Tax=Rhodococcoides corynebacterioides TaxID=53972 RepID=UPI001C9B1722|nr:TOMM precursor leader peptide-binding protein [Rhodococcus corynebacterioides]MBY6363644.1 TOMM precursor leader peptide-binding protein [Rhodococcus corynebacterioides]